jgi:hypothetical protein
METSMSTLTGRVTDVNLLTEIAEALQAKHGLRYFIDVNDGESCKAKELALKKAQRLSPQTLGRLIAADPQTDDHSPELVWVNEWLSLAKSPVEVLQRQAALAIFGRISELCLMLPIFDHTCLHCTYLGAMQRVSSVITASDALPHVVDLYACRGHDGFTFVARYGNTFDECITSGRLTPQDPYLVEALKRAHQRGLFVA